MAKTFISFDTFRTVAAKVLNNPSQRVGPGLGKEPFVVDGHRFAGIQQNPSTGSKWARLAQQGRNVVQFVQDEPGGGYIGVSVDGHVTLYDKADSTTSGDSSEVK